MMHKCSLFSGVNELQALRVLSFVAGRCCLMLNSDWLLQLQWQQVEAELQILRCCNIQMIDSNTCTAVDHCLCRETLFTLSSTGLICILTGINNNLTPSCDLSFFLSI